MPNFPKNAFLVHVESYLIKLRSKLLHQKPIAIQISLQQQSAISSINTISTVKKQSGNNLFLFPLIHLIFSPIHFIAISKTAFSGYFWSVINLKLQLL